MSKLSLHRILPCLAVGLTLGVTACNKYELFMLAGYEQVSFSSEVDVLFVIDGSSSMSDEAASMLRNFDDFIETVAGESGAGNATESLADAVGNYISFTADRGRITDYRLAITTTSMVGTDGWSNQPEGGETGLFVGDEPVVYKDDSDATHRFKQNLGCWASCWSAAEMPSDGSYIGVSGDCPFPDSNNDGKVDSNDEVTTQYLDCLCVDVEHPEGDDWDAVELCRSGNELHLESALMALCRAAEDPPEEACGHARSPFLFEDEIDNGDNGDTGDGVIRNNESWVQTNTGWMREDSTVVVVFVTDEGDQSETSVDGLMSGGSDDPQPYLDAFAEFDRTIRFAAIGPDLQCGGESGTDCSLVCNSGGASANGVRRLINIANTTNGFYNSITDSDCEVSDFSKHLKDLGKLLINLQSAFELQSIPDESTIRAYVDEEEVDKAKFNEDTGIYSAGWSYDPGQNAVVFRGSAIPDFNQDVRIYYRPLDGKPRDLPF